MRHTYDIAFTNITGRRPPSSRALLVRGPDGSSETGGPIRTDAGTSHPGPRDHGRGHGCDPNRGARLAEGNAGRRHASTGRKVCLTWTACHAGSRTGMRDRPVSGSHQLQRMRRQTGP